MVSQSIPHLPDAELRKLETSRQSYYKTITIDLAVARDKTKISVPGDYILVTSISGTLSVALNNQNNDLISLNTVRRIRTPFIDMYFTNTAQSGATAVLAIGMDAAFEAEGLLQDIVLNTPAGVEVEPLRMATAYKNVSFDLNTLRAANTDVSTDVGISATAIGLGFSVVSLTAGAVVKVKLNATANDLITLADAMELKDFKLTALFMENASQAANTLVLFVPRA